MQRAEQCRCASCRSLKKLSFSLQLLHCSWQCNPLRMRPKLTSFPCYILHSPNMCNSKRWNYLRSAKAHVGFDSWGFGRCCWRRVWGSADTKPHGSVDGSTGSMAMSDCGREDETSEFTRGELASMLDGAFLYCVRAVLSCPASRNLHGIACTELYIINNKHDWVTHTLFIG